MGERKNFWRLAWPAALEGLLLMLLTAVDLLMVSSLGTLAVAAVSIFSQPRMVILCVSRSFAVALTAYVARRYGENSQQSFAGCARQTLLISVTGGGLLLVLTLLFCENILLLAGAGTQYLPTAIQYAVPALCSLAISAPSIALHGILTGLGDTKTVLKANILGNLINILCNACLIDGIGAFPGFGVLGAGIGTLLGTLATLIFTLSIFCDKCHIATLWGTGEWKPQATYLKHILPLSGGVFAEQAVERAGMFAYSRMVAGLGASSLGIHHICMGLCDVYYSFSQGMGKASLIQAGNDMGATGGKDLKNLSRIVKLESMWTALLACFLLISFREPLLKLYHLEGVELLLGMNIMLFVALVSFPEAQAMTHAGILRGMGHTAYVAKYSLVSIAILRPIITYILVYSLDLQLYGAWIALFIDQSLRAMFSVVGTKILK